MEYGQLGKTGLKVSVIGLGVEHLKIVPAEEVAQIFKLAIREGVNYFDFVWSFSNIVEGLNEALKENSRKAVLAVHLGSCISNDEYKRSRNPVECERYLRMLLDSLKMDSAPVLNIHYIPNTMVWKETSRKGIIDLARKLREEGLAEAIAASTHDPEVVKLAAQSDVIDSVMYQVNVANHGFTERDEALSLCAKLGVGVVAMKPFAGGELLKPGQKVKIPAYKTGWKTMTPNIPEEMTSKLLSYTLDQPGVCTAVTGASSIKELTTEQTSNTYTHLTLKKTIATSSKLLREKNKKISRTTTTIHKHIIEFSSQHYKAAKNPPESKIKKNNQNPCRNRRIHIKFYTFSGTNLPKTPV